MTTVTEIGIALDTVLALHADMWQAIGPALSCSEAEAFQLLLEAADRPDLAVVLIKAHAEADDDEDDLHLDLCRSRDCINPTNDGEGWDGYCGSCADRITNNEKEE